MPPPSPQQHTGWRRRGSRSTPNFFWPQATHTCWIGAATTFEELEFVFSYAHWSNFSKRTTLWKNKTEFFFLPCLIFGTNCIEKDRFKIDPIFRHSDTILLLWISFWHLHFRALLWSAYFKLQQHKILFHSCSVKSRIQNVTLWKGLESVCNVIVMVVGWLRGNYYIVQRVQDPR